MKLVTKFSFFKALRFSVSWAVEMEASKQEFFNWVLIQLVKLVIWRGNCVVPGECEVCPDTHTGNKTLHFRFFRNCQGIFYVLMGYAQFFV